MFLFYSISCFYLEDNIVSVDYIPQQNLCLVIFKNVFDQKS